MSIAQGVSPERGDDSGLTPLVGNVSASSRCSSGSILFFDGAGVARALRARLTACLCYFAPMRGLSNSAGIRPRVRYILVHPIAEALRTSYFIFRTSQAPAWGRNNIGRGVSPERGVTRG